MMGHSFLEIVATGGAVMYPLILCSVVSVAVVIERLWILARAARAGAQLQQAVSAAAGRLTLAELLTMTHQNDSPLSAVYRAILREGGNSDDSRTRTAQRAHAQATRRLKRFVWLLGTIGSLAPFIGLLGTVIGIIRAFENMAATGSGGFAVVAAGISEALIATAGGLLVGVIAIFAYNALMVRIGNLTAEWRDWTEAFLVQLDEPQPSEGTLRRVAASV